MVMVVRTGSAELACYERSSAPSRALLTLLTSIYTPTAGGHHRRSRRPRRPERTDAVVGGLDFFRSRQPGRRVWPVGGYP